MNEKKRINWGKIKKILHYITTVIMYSVFFVMLFIGFILLMYVIDIKRNAASGEYTPPLFSAYVIISPSMEPTIKVQDAVILKRVEAEDIKKGDIITFTSTDDRYSGVTITHRVVGVEQTSSGKYMFRTKGDNNNTEDPTLVGEDYINGKVILKIPKIGYIQYFLSQAYGWIIAIVIPCAGIIIYDIIKVIKLVKKNLVKKVAPTKGKKKETRKKLPKKGSE